MQGEEREREEEDEECKRCTTAKSLAFTTLIFPFLFPVAFTLLLALDHHGWILTNRDDGAGIDVEDQVQVVGDAGSVEVKHECLLRCCNHR